MQTAPTTSLFNSGGFLPSNPGSKSPFRSFATGDLKAAAEARKMQVAGWNLLNLRQDFADESWMRGHIKAAGIKSPHYLEPASVTRLRSLLKRAKVAPQHIQDSLGTTVAGYLKLNPSLPLWAALALVLEATGQFNASSSFHPSTTH